MCPFRYISVTSRPRGPQRCLNTGRTICPESAAICGRRPGREGLSPGAPESRVTRPAPGFQAGGMKDNRSASPSRSRVKLGFRYDLPDPPDTAVTREIAAHATAILARQRITAAILIGYGPGHLVTPVRDPLRGAAGSARISLREVLRVEDGRYWSYLCHDPACCPAEGVPYDPVAHPAAAALVTAGLAAY